MKASTGIK